MIHTQRLDTGDADDNLALLIANQKNNPVYQYRLVSATAVQFTKGTRGYIVITEDDTELVAKVEPETEIVPLPKDS